MIEMCVGFGIRVSSDPVVTVGDLRASVRATDSSCECGECLPRLCGHTKRARFECGKYI